MIICESLQVLETGFQVGINCQNISLDQFFPRSSIYEFLAIQWSIYAMILAFAWSKYGIKRMRI